jgi:hypothetical protein
MGAADSNPVGATKFRARIPYKVGFLAFLYREVLPKFYLSNLRRHLSDGISTGDRRNGDPQRGPAPLGNPELRQTGNGAAIFAR